jgi:hypothetical protein
MGQEAKSTGNYRDKNRPIIKREQGMLQQAKWQHNRKPMPAGCTSPQQRKNKEPTTSERAAEAELKLGAARTKSKLADKRGTDKSRPRAEQGRGRQCRISGVA